ncbi:ABC transporter substrate-binding protein [Kribbella sp. NPDC050820]|uniref:ABC transporter substrate-binding protein n=1 Tax=Kribbella sp. NPDC050820 TaxID=3155408 RepID=UPI0033EB42C2
MSADGEAGGNATGRLVYAEFFAPAAAWAPESDDAQVLSRAGCLESLLRYQADGSPAPSLAASWEQVTPTAWRFKLRDGVQFQNGAPMDANAVVQALQHVLKAKTPARSFNPDVVSGVKAVDISTVEVATSVPDVLLPLRMAAPSTGILAPQAYAGPRINIRGTCTGPFTVVNEVPLQSLELKRNDDYWGGTPGVATAEVRFIADGAARVTQVQTGEADIASVVPAVSLATLEGDAGIELQKVRTPRTAVMLLNNVRPPFDNPLVRRALQHAVDSKAIAATVYEGVAAPAVGPFSPDDPWTPEGAAPASFDHDESKSLLDAAGVDPHSLDFVLIAYNDRPEFADLAAVIQEQVGKLGIKVKIRAGDYASVEPDMLAGRFDAALLSRGYLVDVGDPAGFLRSDYSCRGSFNIAHYCDQQTDAMINEALTTSDPNARHDLEARIAEKLQDDAAGVFLVHESLVTAVRSGVRGFEPHPLNFYVLTKDLKLGVG